MYPLRGDDFIEMVYGDVVGPLIGAVVLGGVHGIEPGHGWPVAASYALDQSNKWLYGFAASLILGIGHLVSSIAMVLVFFYAKGYFNLTQVNGPITVLGDIQIGGPVSLVAGVLLILLGIREYRHGHSHGHGIDRDSDEGNEHGHEHDDSHEHDHSHDHDHSLENDQPHGHAHDRDHPRDNSHDHHDERHHADDESPGTVARLKGAVPFVGGHDHSHGDPEGAANRGLWGIAWFAFLLGFAHEEEFEIIAICAGSNYCLELMLAYALTVIVGIVGLTLLLIAGYHRHEERVERYTPYLPAFSATILSIMGLGFIVGLF